MWKAILCQEKYVGKNVKAPTQTYIFASGSQWVVHRYLRNIKSKLFFPFDLTILLALAMLGVGKISFIKSERIDNVVCQTNHIMLRSEQKGKCVLYSICWFNKTERLTNQFIQGCIKQSNKLNFLLTFG